MRLREAIGLSSLLELDSPLDPLVLTGGLGGSSNFVTTVGFSLSSFIPVLTSNGGGTAFSSSAFDGCHFTKHYD